ncbi:MAG: hypothetical protein LBF64_00305, partial [Oscillospiraceae bacterium]|nr:hypothetical protein [Oscillospiraceae bacterium]
MRLATSYFKSYCMPSGALLRENLKRFWAVPAIGMVCWFFAGIFPPLVSGGAYIIGDAAVMRYLNFAPLVFIFSLISSAVTLRYLFSTGATTAMHTLPFTRGRLYCT